MKTAARVPFVLSAAALGLAMLAGCATPSGPQAVADLKPTTGNTASGTVRFAQSGGMVKVSGEIRGLKPNAEHGFHIHEKGDCSSGDGMSAGGHFNPTTKPHGAPTVPDHHTGDMPMVVADGAGNATLTAELDTATIGSGTTDIVGKSVIVHKDPDDYKTQPTGNSGPRLACAVITKA